jgi:hypothetical protein
VSVFVQSVILSESNCNCNCNLFAVQKKPKLGYNPVDMDIVTYISNIKYIESE